MHGWRRGAMVAGLLVLVATVVAGVYLTRPARLGAITAELLHRVTGAAVTIDGAYLSLDGGLQLEGVRFGVPNLPPELARLGDIESVRVTPNIWALGRGELRLRSIVLLEPTLYLTRHEGDDLYNYQHLLRPSAEPGQQWLIDALPEIFVRGGRLSFAEVGEAGVRSMGTMGVNGRLTRDVEEPAVYRFTLHQHGEQLLPGAVLYGSLDLLKQSVSTELHGFQFTQQQQQLLPAQLRELWQRLDPTGEMPRVTLNYNQAGEGELDAELRMQNVALSIPAPGVEARIRNVTAMLRLSGDRLAIESLTGEIEGIPYALEGDIGAFDLNAPMRLKLVTEPFEIDTSPPPYLAGLPEIVHRHYARYEPTGWFQTTFELWRDEQDGALAYEGTIDVLGARGRYARFPVPAHDLRGQVHITQDEVRIENIRGRTPTGGEVRVSGTVSPLGNEPAVDVLVSVRSGAVDHHLMAALSVRERQIVEMFLNEPARASLIDTGVIRDGASLLGPSGGRGGLMALLAGEGEAVPVFNFGGLMNADVYVTREEGPINAEAEVHLWPASAVPVLFEHWRYPVYMTGGKVVIGPTVTRLEDVQVRGLTGARGRLVGEIHHTAGETVPALTIEDATVPIDALLLASVPSPQDELIGQLGLAGELRASGKIMDDEEGKTDFAITLEMEDGRATPNHGAFTFEQVAGRLLLRRDSATLERMEARRGEGRVTGEGMLSWGGDERRSDLVFAGEGLAVERALIDLLPQGHAGRAQARELFDRHEPEGVVDADLYFGEQAGTNATPLTEGAPPTRLVVRPRALTLTAGGETFALREMTGAVSVMAGQAELEDVTAKLDGGAVSASGVVMLDETGGAALQLSGDLDRMNGPWMALLPEGVSRTIEALEMTGHVRIDHARLLARPRASEGPTLEAVGELSLMDTTLYAGVPIEGLHGKLAFDVARLAGQTMPQFELALDAVRLFAGDREVHSLRMNVRSDEAAEAVRLEQIEARLYDGVLVGHGVFDLQSEPGYQVELALQDVRLEPFLNAPERRREADEAGEAWPLWEPTSAGNRDGRLNASLVLGGRLNDVESRRGSGAIEIHEARLYQRPVSMALLQAVNLSLPLAGAFDRGTGSFLVEGETVYFDDLNLEAPSLAIYGSGTMHYPTRELNLSLRLRNPAGLDLGLISDVFNMVKDQLVGIRITGTVEQPRARVVGLEDIGRARTESVQPE
ncbi:AsmA-like C-terminal region-containing protein [Phycisphaerales bacterium AB-hyl4]|uniref:AsmA-like C-terminal region-containing protein n=1 Tax=Natronomicrosphaera hydrolytica TaxID=3242702 RepID=A0ABV4U3J6_9BACT